MANHPIKTKRACAGTYKYGAYIIERMYDWNTCKPDGRWTFRHENSYANDIFFSKREALEALQELLTSQVNQHKKSSS